MPGAVPGALGEDSQPCWPQDDPKLKKHRTSDMECLPRSHIGSQNLKLFQTEIPEAFLWFVGWFLFETVLSDFIIRKIRRFFVGMLRGDAYYLKPNT